VSRSLVRLSQSKGWVNVLKPFLEEKLHHSWIDPRECKDEKKFMWRYFQGYFFAQAVKEILEFVDRAKDEYKALEKKSKGEVEKDKFRI